MKKHLIRPVGLVLTVLALLVLVLISGRAASAQGNPADTPTPETVQVTIIDGDNTYTLASESRLPADYLDQAGLSLQPEDRLLLHGQPVDPERELKDAGFYHFQIRRAVKIELAIDSEEIVFYSSAPTLGHALHEMDIPLFAADRLDPPASTPLDGPIEAALQRSRVITIRYADGEKTVRTSASTVGDALAEAGFSLQGMDYTEPSAQSPLPEDGQIRLVRVQEKIVIEQEPLPYETELQPAPEVELDKREVLQEGELGIIARRIRVRYEDGKEVIQSVEAEWVAKEPRKRVVGYGTKIVIRTLDTPDGPIEYWRAVPMYATSYSPCRIFKDRCDDYTALGHTLKKGVVAMTNFWCRYTCGDRVYVPGYGVGIVADTGGGIPGRYWIDLGYSEEDYVSWHQWVTVYFLTPVPSNFMWILP